MWLSEQDRTSLERLVRDGRTEQRVARRARILLAMADPATVVEELAYRLGVTRATVWNVCRRYEARGVLAVDHAPRPGPKARAAPLLTCV